MRNKKGKVKIVLTGINILLLRVSLFSLIRTSQNNKIINIVKRERQWLCKRESVTEEEENRE